MPTVPVVRGPEVSSRGIHAATNSLQFTPNDFGAGVAQAGQQAINVFAEAKGKADLALAQDALLQFQAGADDQYAKLQKLQGKNAIGQGEATVGNIRSIGEELAATLPEGRSRETFIRQSADLGLQYRRQAIGYETGQIRAFEDSRQQGLLNGWQNQIASTPQMFSTLAPLARQSIIMYGASRGQSDEEINANWLKWQRSSADDAFNTRYASIYQGMMGPNGKIQVTDTPSEAQIFSAMIRQESGGNQFAKDGSPLTSSKGAVGVAQVMESTGPEAARLAGVPWDRDRWLNDPQYNAQIGQAYFGAQMKKYNNPVLAVAAYNAGPGAVDGWLKQIGDPRTGQISNAQFAASIPFDETRNYVANVVGSAGAIPEEATMSNLNSQPFFSAMSPTGKAQAMSKIAGLYDMQASAGRVALQSKMQDDMASLEAGNTVTPVTDKEWLAVMPLMASPAERMQLEKTFQQYQQAMTLQPVYQAIMQGTPQQGSAAVQAIDPKESDPDFKFKKGLYATAQTKLNQTLKAREDDPGTWLQKYSPVAQSAFQAYQSNQVSGEYLVSRLEAEKSRLGIKSKKVIPDAMVSNILTQIDNNKESSVTAIQSIGQQFGKYSDQVMMQVQKNAYPELQVIMATENPRAANALWQNRSVKTPDLRGSFEKPEADKADSSWNDQAKDFAGTMVVQPGGTAVWGNFNDQGKRLTYINMQRGMSASDAAKQAYQDILGSQYQTNGTWRVPTRLALDVRDVADGASQYLKTLTGNQVMPLIGDPRLPESVNREQSISRIKDKAQWVTNSDETGLTLMMNGLLVNGADGGPITVTFPDLVKLGSANRSSWNSVTKFFGTPTQYTPGQSQGYSAESQRDRLVDIIQSGQQTGR
ncbi:transglycosylase SLT domain-containing protein [Pectobacterium sp. 21LCBS03]|uniref:transglycosylase SLT domain-containing protein n=1 Tax=Pectobacterium sp. 21LCBS03 TaxID=2935858 RepID=UPI00200E3006|nr:transglycosylase SLT domain-containing protein [Pectobacterium sp. 21LCBS03]UPY96266.1 transglycosylase SLT domain-containing protein [Pectobacterium sp. 21LCBS03]